MSKPVTHFSKVHVRGREAAEVRITGTLCNRMMVYGDIVCSSDPAEVTCKLCQRDLAAQRAQPTKRCETNQCDPDGGCVVCGAADGESCQLPTAEAA